MAIAGTAIMAGITAVMPNTMQNTASKVIETIRFDYDDVDERAKDGGKQIGRIGRQGPHPNARSPSRNPPGWLASLFAAYHMFLRSTIIACSHRSWVDIEGSFLITT
jgi:hypothetical protein